MIDMTLIESAVHIRNKLWAENPLIPSWVDIEKVSLDQFFTHPEIAKQCHNSLLTCIKNDGANESNYKFIEPSAGHGAFYDLLPRERRIGIDIMPLREEFIEHDFLDWEPKKNGYRYAVIGNPPFGYRAWLALTFINHAAQFADYIGMILPMAFQSDGKGSPKHRVNGLELLHTEYLSQNSFTDLYGHPIKINALWQVWKRGVNNLKSPPQCKDWIDLFTVDMRKERLCGQKRIHEADYFLQRTFYRDSPSLVLDFSEVRYVCGYGIVIKKDRERVIDILQNTDWRKYSNLSAHNCRHISMCHINRALTDAGFIDD